MLQGARVAVFNATTQLTDDQLGRAVADLQKQAEQGDAPKWAIGTELVFVRKGTPVPNCTWALVVTDDTEQTQSLADATLRTLSQ